MSILHIHYSRIFSVTEKQAHSLRLKYLCWHANHLSDYSGLTFSMAHFYFCLTDRLALGAEDTVHQSTIVLLSLGVTRIYVCASMHVFRDVFNFNKGDCQLEDNIMSFRSVVFTTQKWVAAIILSK